MKNARLIVLAILLSSCGGLRSSVGLYGDSPVAQSVPGSNAQAVMSRTVEFSGDETFEATKKAMLRLGYNVEEANPKRSKITGSGIFRCTGSLRTPVTMAIYIEQISRKPESKFTIVLDRHSIDCWGGGETLGANELASEIQKVLSTF
jgi:hypothetical protein